MSSAHPAAALGKARPTNDATRAGTCLNGVLFECLRPYFDKMLAWDRYSKPPVRSTTFIKFIGKSMQACMFRCIYQMRQSLSLYTYSWQWLTGDAVNYAVYDAIQGLCSKSDPRKLMPLYQILGAGHEYEASVLAWGKRQICGRTKEVRRRRTLMQFSNIKEAIAA